MPKKNKEIEEEEIEEEPEKENQEEIQEENPEEKEDKKIETPKKKKKKYKKGKKTEEIEDTDEKVEQEEKKNDEENKEETKHKKSKKKKKKKKKSEKEETEEKEEKEENEDNKENKENNNIEENNQENEKEKEKENNIKEEEINTDNNINEEQKEEEQKQELKEEEKKQEEKEEEKKQEEKEEENNNKQSKPKEKVTLKTKNKHQKKPKKEIIEEEEIEVEEQNENEEKEEQEEDIEEQETRPTERKSSKKKKGKEKKQSKYHLNPNFEKEINAAYKILLKISKAQEEDIEEEEEEDEEEEQTSESQLNADIQTCEKKLRSALNICKSDPYMIINRSIIDKLGRISLHERININYILGNIYISLMDREALFDYEDDDNFDINDLLVFINKVIQFREIIKNTTIYISYDESLKQFLFFLSEQFELEEAQMKSIKKILDEDTGIDHSNLVTNKTFEKFIISLNRELESQSNLYEQYEIFIQNKQKIIEIIEACDPEESTLHNEYLKFGKCLAYMFFNPYINLYAEKNAQIEQEEEDEDEKGEMLLFYNGEESKGEIGIINGEKFCVQMDDKVKYLRKKLGEIIIKYCQQFIDIIDVFQIQYIIFILITRLYSCKYTKYETEVNAILSESIINMCFFKTSPMKVINDFINKILESEKPENSELQKLLIIKTREVLNEEGFLYQMPDNIEKKYKNKIIKEEPKKKKKKTKKKEKGEEEGESSEEEDDLENKDQLEKYEEIIGDENLFLLHNDLKFAYFNKKIIKSGEKFIFFEEINRDYSVLDFCFILSDLDIKFTITDMTEGKEIYSKERIMSNIDSPLKLLMFFTNPRILKFEFDNSYSWVRSKTIKYKTNIFYPKYPYNFNYQILNGQYINNISKTKKDLAKKKYKGKKKLFSDDTDKLLILKLNEKNKAFNCVNIKDNLEAINTLLKNKFISIYSLYIKIKDEKNPEDKSYFYYYSNEKKELIEFELNKENFENLFNKTITEEDNSLNLINLYIINGDDNNKNNYTSYSLKQLLGFEPNLISKILFFIQNLNQAQLLYCLYKQIISNEIVDVVIILNYTKFSGYQLNIFDSDEILDLNKCEAFNGLDKNKNLEENAKVICDGIKKFEFGEERKVLVVICSSIDEKENEITADKIGEKINEIIGKENNIKNVNVIKAGNEFNNELKNYSHLFYLNN